ncbi:MAG: hypothetical protein R2824_31280 [Saprospiraceae bacterium]|nr:hypothetical protein [Lewinella sp.]
MNSILKLLVPILCGLTLMACNNHATTGDGQKALSTEAITAIAGVAVAASENYGPYMLFKASDFNPMGNASKLKKLAYYAAPARPETDNEEVRMEDVVASLFPLGWSEAGRFAYATYATDYSGTKMVNYMIKDMAKGDTLWTQYFSYAMVEDTADLYSELEADTVILINGTETEEELFRYAWILHEKTVLPELEKAGIRFDPAMDFRKQSNYGANIFEVEQTVKSEDFFAEYTLKSNKLAPKVIYSDYFGEQPEIAGMIKSPFNETIVVVCRQRRPLFEMENEVVPLLEGYSLD